MHSERTETGSADLLDITGGIARSGHPMKRCGLTRPAQRRPRKLPAAGPGAGSGGGGGGEAAEPGGHFWCALRVLEKFTSPCFLLP